MHIQRFLIRDFRQNASIVLADDQGDDRDSWRESFTSEGVAREDRIKDLPDVRHLKTRAPAPKRTALSRTPGTVFLFELTVQPRLPEYHIVGIRSRNIPVGRAGRSPQKLSPNSNETLVQWSVVFRAGILPTEGPLVAAEIT